MIQCGPEMCGNIERASTREWLETNRLGGFASSTILGLNTRRYHGLLTAATQPPVGRMVLLSKLEEILVIDGRRYELSVNRYPGIVHPQGYRYLRQFRLDPFPVFTYVVEDVEIEESIFMVHGQNTTVVECVLKTNGKNLAGAVQLDVRPLIAFRDYHSTTHENGALNPHVQTRCGMGKITEENSARGLEWVIKNKDRYNVRVVSISLGGDEDVASRVRRSRPPILRRPCRRDCSCRPRRKTAFTRFCMTGSGKPLMP